MNLSTLQLNHSVGRDLSLPERSKGRAVRPRAARVVHGVERSFSLVRGTSRNGNNILLTTHLAESREEMEMFRDASGPLYEFIKSIGRPMDDCGNETPLGLFLDLIGSGGSPNRPRAIEVNRPYLSWIVAHLNELTENDFELLERSNSKFHVVHCPRSHNYFGRTARSRSIACARSALTFASARTVSRATKASACLMRCARFKRNSQAFRLRKFFKW